MTESIPSSSSTTVQAEKLNPFRLIVQSSDVISDMRVNVSKEGSAEVIWYKERFLSDEEIIEHVVHNPTSTLCWTIHRPKRGWYIRLRAPSFPPGVFVPLIPVPRTSPQYADAALSFNCQSSALPSADPVAERPSTSSVHSYPPTPSTLVVQSPSPKAVQAKLEEMPKDLSSKQRRWKTHPTQFILTPHSTQVVHPTSNSFFARALSVIKNNRPSHSNSFTLTRIPAASLLLPPPPYARSPKSPTEAPQLTSSAPLPPPVLTYHDRTPILTVGTFTGLIEFDKEEEQLLGVETSLWVAVALTYLEFLEERESYLAALHD